jgi:lauroyl/myristoyl acyltransferase
MLNKPALTYLVYRFFLQRLPTNSAYRLIQNLAPMLTTIDPFALEHAKQTLGAKQIPTNFQTLMQQIEAEEILDTFILANRRSEVTVELLGLDTVKMLKNDRQKVILTTAHFGRYWPVGLGLNRAGLSSQAVIKDRLDANVYGLPRAEFNFRRWKLHVMQDVFGCSFHTTDKHPRQLARSLINQPIISLFDVPVASTSSRATVHSLFTRTLRLNPNPARLAQVHDAYIIPFMNTYSSGPYFQYQFFEPLRARDFELAELNSQLLAILELQIQHNPASWWLWPALPHFLTDTDESFRTEITPD